jgi:hypothetical protein
MVCVVMTGCAADVLFSSAILSEVRSAAASVRASEQWRLQGSGRTGL